MWWSGVVLGQDECTQCDRQTLRQTDRQAGTLTDRQTDRQTHFQSEPDAPERARRGVGGYDYYLSI